ncbi:MAG: HigA family addiction module antitoxin [Campylobacterales bacterium]|nr:HigA family addiction module antitoxin [Campylobacterales bacterium]
MKMFNPPHPGEFIKEVYLDPYKIGIREIADKLKVSPSTFSRVVRGKSSVSPEMALRLSKTIGRTPQSWLLMQDNYDLYYAEKNFDLESVEKFAIPA